MLIFFDWKRLEASLVQMTGALCVVVCMPTHRVGVCQPAKKFDNLSVGFGLDDEMPMVRHHAIADDLPRRSQHLNFQPFGESIVMAIVMEKRPSTITTGDNVINRTGELNSWFTSHSWMSSAKLSIVFSLTKVSQE